MRIFTASVLLAGLFTTGAALAQTPAGTLTGKMAPFNYVFGAPWNCTANVPAMGGEPAHTENSTTTFDVVPNNVMHVHVASPQYAADQYFGYSAQGNAYWSTTSDSMGAAAAETSPDGKIYKGTISMGQMTGTAQDTYTKVSDTKVTIHSSATIGGKAYTTEVSCSR